MAKHDADITLQMNMEADDVTATISELQSRFKELSKLDFGKSLSKGFAQALKDMNRVGNRTREIMQEVKKLETVRPTTLYTNLSKELDGLIHRQTELNDKNKTAYAQSIGYKTRLQLIRDETAAKNEQIKKENELIRLQNESSKGRKKAEKPLIDYKQLDEYKTSLQEYRRTNMQAMNYQRTLAAVSVKINEVTAKMHAMEQAGTHVFDGVGTVQYNMYIEELRELSDELTKYVNIAEYASNMPGFTPDSATSKWQSFMAVLRETHPVLAQIGESTGTVVQTIIDNFGLAASNIKQGFGTALQALPQLASKVVAGLSKLGGKAITWGLQKIGSLAKTAAKHLADMAKNLAKSVGSGVINKLKALGSAITGVGKSTGKSNNAFKAGFMTLLRYGLGIRSVYFLFRRLRKALGEGIGNLAQYSPAFNTVISNFISALTQLKNSFATAFAPIINVVAPILTTFINLVSEAVTKVGMLIAALTGQKTFIRAKGVQTDFAASLDKTSGSTDKANKAAEKYKRTLAGFDDVEILKNPDSGSGSGGSGGGGGGGGGTSPSDMFETVAMPSAFEDWAEKIKEAWANADFTELGQVLAEKIANALDNIPWDTVKAYAGKFGKSFATFLNGLMFVDEEGNSHLATSIGKTIGEAINTVFTFANEFVTNIDPKLVGNFFADLFNSAINTIDWNLIADTLSKGINNIFSSIETFADKFNFANLGTSIKNAIVKTLNGLDWTTIHSAVASVATGLANFVNSFFTPDLFGSLGTTIAKALNTAISGIKTFAVNWDAKQFGQAIGNGINNFFETFNFESAGVTFGTLITKVGTALTNAVSSVKWEDVGADLTDFIISIPWSDVFGTAEQLTEAISGAAGEALAGIAKAIFEGIQDAVDKYFEEHKGETGEQIALGILKEIADYLWKTVNWPVTYILVPFITKFCEAFGISSPATNPELLEAARNIGRGILNGIAEPFKNVADWVKEHILDPINKALDNPIDFVKDLFAHNDTSNDSSMVLNFKAKIVSFVEDLKDKVINFKAKLTEWTQDLKDKVINFKAKMTVWAEELKDKAINFKAKMTVWAEELKDKVINFKAKITEWYHDLKNRVINFKAKMTEWTQDLKSKVINFKAKMTVWEDKLKSKVIAFKAKMSTWQDKLKNKVIPFKAKITSFQDKLKNKVLSFKAKISSWFKKERGGVYTNGRWSNIPQYASGGAPRHGTMFVAGEAGAEAVGHINGRTEVLNQSQMASVMYNAVLNGTANLTKTITGHMTVCTNAVISNMGAMLAVLNFTSTQIYDITNLVEKLNGGLSDIVAGKVIPTRTSSDNADLMKALNTIIQNQNNAVTREELQDILADAFRRYMNIDFYLGDEQVARHANAGNFKLNRRYGTV